MSNSNVLTPRFRPTKPGWDLKTRVRLVPVLLGVAALFAGCVITTQYDQGDVVSRSLKIGALQDLACSGASERLKSQVLGLGFGNKRAVLGYADEDRICLPIDSCSAIFFVNSEKQAQTIRELFPELPSACLAHDTPVNKPKKG